MATRKDTLEQETLAAQIAPPYDEFVGPPLPQEPFESEGASELGGVLNPLDMMNEVMGAEGALDAAMQTGIAEVPLLDPVEGQNVLGQEGMTDEKDIKQQGPAGEQKAPPNKMALILQMIGYAAAGAASKNPGQTVLELLKMSQQKIEASIERKHEFVKLAETHAMNVERDQLAIDAQTKARQENFENSVEMVGHQTEAAKDIYSANAAVQSQYDIVQQKYGLEGNLVLEGYKVQMQNWAADLSDKRAAGAAATVSEAEWNKMQMLLSLSGEHNPAAINAAFNLYAPGGTGGTQEDVEMVMAEFQRKLSLAPDEWAASLRLWAFQEGNALRAEATKIVYDENGEPIDTVPDHSKFSLGMAQMMDVLAMNLTGGTAQAKKMFPGQMSRYYLGGAMDGLHPVVQQALVRINELYRGFAPNKNAMVKEYTDALAASLTDNPAMLRQALKVVGRMQNAQSQMMDKVDAARGGGQGDGAPASAWGSKGTPYQQ